MATKDEDEIQRKLDKLKDQLPGDREAGHFSQGKDDEAYKRYRTNLLIQITTLCWVIGRNVRDFLLGK